MPRVKKLMKGRASRADGGGDDVAVDPAEAARLEYEQYLKEERERKMRQDALRKKLRDRLEEQQRLDAVNSRKVEEIWRTILRQVKLERLRGEIEVLAQMHEREVDRRDTLVAMLDKDLDEAEDQYQLALRAHIHTVDELIDLQRSRLHALQSEFEKAVETLESEFSAERAHLSTQHNRDRAELLAVMTEMESQFAEQEALANQEFQTVRDDLKGRNSDENSMLHKALEMEIQKLEKNFEREHSVYMMTNDQRQESFKMMMMKDEDSQRIMKDYQRDIQRYQEKIAFWRTKLQNMSREQEERNNALRTEKSNVQRHFRELKLRMQKFREGQAKRLTHLTVACDRTQKELRKKLATAEKILRVAELCRKLETEREAVLPVMDLEADAAAAAIQQMREQAEPDLLASAAEPEPYHPRMLAPDGQPVPLRLSLDTFFRRYNKIHLDTLALEHEEQQLQQEHDELRTILKQYLDGITINDDVLAGANPLMIVNNRSNAAPAGPSMAPGARPVVVEAAHTMARSMR